MEAWRLKMEPWRVCWPVVEDSQHFDEEQDPDPHWSEKLVRMRIRIKVKSWIRTAFKWCGSATLCKMGNIDEKNKQKNMFWIEAASLASELDPHLYFF